MTAHDGHHGVVFHPRVLRHEFVESINEIADALARHRDPLRDEEDDALVSWQRGMKARLLFVLLIIDMRINRVGNIGHVHTGEQRALTGLVGNPLTASHEMNATVVVKLALAVEDARGQVVRTAVAWQQPAVVAHVSIRRAVERVVTDARSRPHVVHRPYHRFATLDNAADALERQETLIDPRQVNDVGLLKLRQFVMSKPELAMSISKSRSRWKCRWQ